MAICGPKAQIGVVCYECLKIDQAERVVMPFFLSLFILTMIPPTYAVSPPSMDTPFVDRCTGEFAASAERDMVDMFESDTDRMLATLAFRSAIAFSIVVSREACICFESAYSEATGPSSPLSINDLWNTFLALEQDDTAMIDDIWEPLQSLPQGEKINFWRDLTVRPKL